MEFVDKRNISCSRQNPNSETSSLRLLFKEIFIISSFIKLLFHRGLFGVNIVSKVNITSVLNEPVVEEKCLSV